MRRFLKPNLQMLTLGRAVQKHRNLQKVGYLMLPRCMVDKICKEVVPVLARGSETDSPTGAAAVGNQGAESGPVLKINRPIESISAQRRPELCQRSRGPDRLP